MEMNRREFPRRCKRQNFIDMRSLFIILFKEENRSLRSCRFSSDSSVGCRESNSLYLFVPRVKSRWRFLSLVHPIAPARSPVEWIASRTCARATERESERTRERATWWAVRSMKDALRGSRRVAVLCTDLHRKKNTQKVEMYAKSMWNYATTVKIAQFTTEMYTHSQNPVIFAIVVHATLLL